MDYEKLEREVFDLINFVRKNPQSVIPELEGMLKCFKNKYFKIPSTNINIITHEGDAAVKEAIQYLEKIKPKIEFQDSIGLYLAAKDHIRDIGINGLASHEGTDGSRMCDRIDKYGEWQISIAENIGFDDSKALDIVLNMIIDDGNNSRGHRMNIFSDDYRSVGVACGPHRDYKYATVINFAVSYKDNPELQQKKKVTKPEEPFEIYRRKTTIPVETQKQNDGFYHGNNDSLSFRNNTAIVHKDTVASNKNEYSIHRPSELEMPDGAVSCKVKKFIKTVGNKRTTKIIRTFTMNDGSIEVIEEVDVEYV